MRKYLTERHKKNISQSLKGRIYKKKHGENSKNSPEYRTWASIKSRCYNPKVISYKDYATSTFRKRYRNFVLSTAARKAFGYSVEDIQKHLQY